jgi:WD40 repeat protein
MQEILDLKCANVNVWAFSPATRELFVSHCGADTNLYQWNIAEKKLLHAYPCPKDHLRWDEVAVSLDGELLVAATYPQSLDTKAKLLFIDTRDQRIRYATDYEHLVSKITFDHSGKFIWIATTLPGPDRFVYDREGKKHSEFTPTDFEPETKDQLWDVEESKGGPPSGLFYRDVNRVVHRLIEHPFNQDYALTKDGKYIGTSTWDQRVRVWRTSDLKEVFNERIGLEQVAAIWHPVRLLYDSGENQFLVLGGGDNTNLRAIGLP